jgi:hypothetical protein
LNRALATVETWNLKGNVLKVYYQMVKVSFSAEVGMYVKFVLDVVMLAL